MQKEYEVKTIEDGAEYEKYRQIIEKMWGALARVVTEQPEYVYVDLGMLIILLTHLTASVAAGLLCGFGEKGDFLKSSKAATLEMLSNRSDFNPDYVAELPSSVTGTYREVRANLSHRDCDIIDSALEAILIVLRKELTRAIHVNVIGTLLGNFIVQNVALLPKGQQKCIEIIFDLARELLDAWVSRSHQPTTITLH